MARARPHAVSRGYRAGPPVVSPLDELVDRLVERETAVAAMFESRWTRQALRRQDPELDRLLGEQRELFTEALLARFAADIREHGEAMVRGWHLAIQTMAACGVEDDAYLLGEDLLSGARVAIGVQRAAEQRVRELYGEEVIFLMPDEVAAMVAMSRPVAVVKALWPGAQVMTVRQKAGGGDEE